MKTSMGWSMRSRALFAGIGLLLAAFATNILAATEVRSVRLWRAPDNTRLVFDLSGPVQHSVFTLTAPDRIVIDINGAQLGTQLDKLSIANTPIKSVRSAQRSPTDLRVVIDVAPGVTPKSFTLAPNQQYGNRLVVDLYDQPSAAEEASAPQVATAPSTPQPPVSLLSRPPASCRRFPVASATSSSPSTPATAARTRAPSGPRGSTRRT